MSVMTSEYLPNVPCYGEQEEDELTFCGVITSISKNERGFIVVNASFGYAGKHSDICQYKRSPEDIDTLNNFGAVKLQLFLLIAEGKIAVIIASDEIMSSADISNELETVIRQMTYSALTILGQENVDSISFTVVDQCEDVSINAICIND